jgi:hypothetical protein
VLKERRKLRLLLFNIILKNTFCVSTFFVFPAAAPAAAAAALVYTRYLFHGPAFCIPFCFVELNISSVFHFCNQLFSAQNLMKELEQILCWAWLVRL